MGTRADFYNGVGKDARWIGSIAFDGYPDGGVDGHVFTAKTTEEFEARVAKFFEGRDDVSLPADGWPWPWDDSGTTDFAYCFDGEKVVAACFGRGYFNPLQDEAATDDLPMQKWPDMRAVANAQIGGKRSGLLIVTCKQEQETK